jgi:hypothetical protein
MDAEPTEWPCRQLGGDDIRDGANSCLERCPFDHEAQRMTRDRTIAGVGRRILEREWFTVGFDEHVDQVDRDGVVEFGQTTRGARKLRIGLNDQEPIGIAARPQELGPGGAIVQGEVDLALAVRRRGLRHHYPWCKPLQDRSELAESPWYVLNAMALREKDSLSRSEKAATVGDSGLGQHVVVVEEKRPAEDEVLPVVASTQGGQKGVGIGRAQPESDAIDGPHQRGRLGGCAGDRHDRRRLATGPGVR